MLCNKEDKTMWKGKMSIHWFENMQSHICCVKNCSEKASNHARLPSATTILSDVSEAVLCLPIFFFCEKHKDIVNSMIKKDNFTSRNIVEDLTDLPYEVCLNCFKF